MDFLVSTCPGIYNTYQSRKTFIKAIDWRWLNIAKAQFKPMKKAADTKSQKEAVKKLIDLDKQMDKQLKDKSKKCHSQTRKVEFPLVLKKLQPLTQLQTEPILLSHLHTALILLTG